MSMKLKFIAPLAAILLASGAQAAQVSGAFSISGFGWTPTGGAGVADAQLDGFWCDGFGSGVLEGDLDLDFAIDADDVAREFDVGHREVAERGGEGELPHDELRPVGQFIQPLGEKIPAGRVFCLPADALCIG